MYSSNYNSYDYIKIQVIKIHVYLPVIFQYCSWLVTNNFLTKNNSKMKIKDEEKNAKVMIGIREGFYLNQEIKEWIKNGKIKEFKR